MWAELHCSTQPRRTELTPPLFPQQCGGCRGCERGQFRHSAKPATTAGIDAGDPWFRLQSVQAGQEVATRHGAMTVEQGQGF